MFKKGKPLSPVADDYHCLQWRKDRAILLTRNGVVEDSPLVVKLSEFWLSPDQAKIDGMEPSPKFCL